MHAGKQLEALLPLPDGASQASLIVFIIWMKQERARGLRVAYIQNGVMLIGLLLFKRGITKLWGCLGKTLLLPPG